MWDSRYESPTAASVYTTGSTSTAHGASAAPRMAANVIENAPIIAAYRNSSYQMLR